MTLKEAIKIKERTGEEFFDFDPDEIEEADRLSIEALKRHKSRASLTYADMMRPLPGETKD